VNNGDRTGRVDKGRSAKCNSFFFLGKKHPALRNPPWACDSLWSRYNGSANMCKWCREFGNGRVSLAGGQSSGLTSTSARACWGHWCSSAGSWNRDWIFHTAQYETLFTSV
jgi:hypothetical protein